MNFKRSIFLIGIGVFIVWTSLALCPLNICQAFWLLCGREPIGMNPFGGLAMLAGFILCGSFLINKLIKIKKQNKKKEVREND